MPVTTRKDRIFRRMARDTPSHKIVRIDRDEVMRLYWEDKEGQNRNLIDKYFALWIRFMKIKHGSQVRIDLWHDFDIDYNMYRFGGAVYALEQRRPNEMPVV